MRVSARPVRLMLAGLGDLDRAALACVVEGARHCLTGAEADGGGTLPSSQVDETRFQPAGTVSATS